jgi:hypothetical protein
MQLGSPIDAVSAALYHAANIALPNQRYQTRDFGALHSLPQSKRDVIHVTGDYPTREVVRRPDANQCTVIAMFPQVWGSTALGFGGVGGAAMTPAYTVAIQGPDRTIALYWAGQLAYVVSPVNATPEQRESLLADLTLNSTEPRRSAVERYGATIFEEKPTA